MMQMKQIRFRVVDMIENKVLAGKHYGPPDNIMDTYAELVEVAQANHYDIIGSPKEVLIKGFTIVIMKMILSLKFNYLLLKCKVI